jgi:antitoxin component YwqK of YwqJK toxin-antitoxin module
MERMGVYCSTALVFIALFIIGPPVVARGEDTVHVVTRCGVTDFTSSQLVVEEFETNEYGAKHGFYRVYLAKEDCTKGDLLIDGSYKEDLRDGKWTYGNSFETFENGRLHGPKETRYSDGTLLFQGSYYQGSPDGVHTRWYESGNKEEEWTYYRGLYNGPHRVWYDAPGGQLQEETWWAGGKEHGPSTGWWETGVMQFQGTYYHGLMVGPYTDWFESGKPAYEWFFSNDGQPCGVWLSYDSYGSSYETDYGACKGYEVTKEPYPDPEQVPAELRGHVRDRETGAPVHGATVQADVVQGLTNTEGFYALQFTEQGKVTVSISKDGYYTRTATFDLTGYEYRTANCVLKPVKVTEKPAVTEVKSQYGNFFLESLTVNNTYTVSVDWGGGRIRAASGFPQTERPSRCRHRPVEAVVPSTWGPTSRQGFQEPRTP